MLFGSGVFAWADVIYLSNGRSVEGVITREDDRGVEVKISIGTVRFRMSEIARIERAGAQNQELQQQWSSQKAQDDKEAQLREQQRQMEAEQERQRQDKAPKTVQGRSNRMGHIIVQAKINGKQSIPLLVDTGASTIMLSQKAAARLGLLSDPSKVMQSKGQVADGRIVDMAGVMLESVVVDNVEAKNVQAAVGTYSDVNNESEGLLGMSFLKQFKFSIDSQNGKIVLQKPSEDSRR
jgi:clan AA aspartic protease (TIGR02281 family)